MPVELPSSKPFEYLRPALGVHLDVPDDLYHQWEDCSNSRLTTLHESSPAHVRASIDNPTDPTPALVIGTAVHLLTLLPDQFNDRYVKAGICVAVKKSGDACGNFGKALIGGEWLCGVHARAERTESTMKFVVGDLVAQGFIIEYLSTTGSYYFKHNDGRRVRVADHVPGAMGLRKMLAENRQDIRIDLPPYGNDDPRIVLSGDQWDTCQRVRDAIMAHDEARELLEGTIREQSVIFTEPETSMRCKMRLDIDNKAADTLVDLKTTEAAKPDDFQWSIWKYGYHRQAAFYQVGMNRATGHTYAGSAIIAAEKVEPFAVAVFEIKAESIERGWDELRPLIRKYAQCEMSGKWPAYPGITKIGIPDVKMRFQN